MELVSVCERCAELQVSRHRVLPMGLNSQGSATENRYVTLTHKIDCWHLTTLDELFQDRIHTTVSTIAQILADMFTCAKVSSTPTKGEGRV